MASRHGAARTWKAARRRAIYSAGGVCQSRVISWGERCGIEVEFNRSRREVNWLGWYDSNVGIEGRSMRLGEFLTELGITLADCRRALSEEATDRG